MLDISIRNQVYQRDNMLCRYCGVLTLKTEKVLDHQATLEHVMPESLGGTYTLDNLILACRKCNQKMSALLNNTILEIVGTKFVTTGLIRKHRDRIKTLYLSRTQTPEGFVMPVVVPPPPKTKGKSALTIQTEQRDQLLREIQVFRNMSIWDFVLYRIGERIKARKRRKEKATAPVLVVRAADVLPPKPLIVKREAIDLRQL